MKVILRENLLVLCSEDPEEQGALVEWGSEHSDSIVRVLCQKNGNLNLHVMGTRQEVLHEPINVTSKYPDPKIRLISNLAHTPFELDGRSYASVEAYWQGLKHTEQDKRAEVAGLYGSSARRIGADLSYTDTLQYNGQTIRVGTHEHWRLMAIACLAKFTQHAGARAALLSTGSRPLVHRVRKDSLTIPGVIMAEIWTKIRSRLVAGDLEASG